MAVGKFSFPKKCPSSRVHVRVDKALGSFFLFGFEEEERRGGIPVAPSRLYASLVSPLPITLLCFFPPFSPSRPGKNGKRMKEEYRGETRKSEEHFEMVGGGSPRLSSFSSSFFFFSLPSGLDSTCLDSVIHVVPRVSYLRPSTEKLASSVVTIDNVRSARALAKKNNNFFFLPAKDYFSLDNFFFSLGHLFFVVVVWLNCWLHVIAPSRFMVLFIYSFFERPAVLFGLLRSYALIFFSNFIFFREERKSHSKFTPTYLTKCVLFFYRRWFEFFELVRN